MSVYTPFHRLARRAAEAGVALAKGEKVDAPARINNGRVDVPSILLEPVVVDKSNIDDTVVKDDYQKKEAIYQNAPAGAK
jgi:D-xylose transport system substrate-binding protein